MKKSKKLIEGLIIIYLLTIIAHGSVLFTEDWDTGIIDSNVWDVYDIGDNGNIVLDDLGSGNYALALTGRRTAGTPVWGDVIYSVDTYDRGGFLSITFDTWQGGALPSYSCHAGFHHSNAGPGPYNTMEAAIGYIYQDLRAAGGKDGNHGITGTLPLFTAAIANAYGMSNAITFKITLGDVYGGRWEWSNDGGATWIVERDTIGNSSDSNNVTNYIGFGLFGGGQWDIAVIDNIVVEENFHLIRQSDGSTDVNEWAPSSDTYTIVLGGAPSQNVTVTVDPDSQLQVNGAGQGNVVNLTFTPSDYDVPQTVTVEAIDDSTAEGDHTGVISHTTTSGDTGFDGLVIEDVVVNIADDDQIGFEISESGESTDITEGGAGDTYTITALGPPGQTVTVTVDPDGQIDVGEGAGVADQLTFNSSNWQTPQEVTVSAYDDSDSEGPHTGTISHTSQSGDGNWDNLVIADVVANITDNENYCGEPDQVYVDGDIGGPDGVGDEFRDCYVNIYDLAYMVAQWLDCTDLFIGDCSW